MIIYCAECRIHLVDHEGQLCPVCAPTMPLDVPLGPLPEGLMCHYFVDADGNLFQLDNGSWIPLIGAL